MALTVTSSTEEIESTALAWVSALLDRNEFESYELLTQLNDVGAPKLVDVLFPEAMAPDRRTRGEIRRLKQNSVQYVLEFYLKCLESAGKVASGTPPTSTAQMDREPSVSRSKAIQSSQDILENLNGFP